MPSRDVQDHLTALYDRADDPWLTHSSPYEQAKFAQTVASLPFARYARGLEVGCGAGGLTALLTQRCDALVAMDCTERAIKVAKTRCPQPNVTFAHGSAPTLWSDEAPDLVVLSEVLYFLTDAENAGLAARLANGCADGCDCVLVNWLGDTGGGINGPDAAQRLIDAVRATHDHVSSERFEGFQVDILRLHGPYAPTGAID